MGRLVLQGTLRWSSSPYAVACLASWFYAIFLTNPQGVGYHPLYRRGQGVRAGKPSAQNQKLVAELRLNMDLLLAVLPSGLPMVALPGTAPLAWAGPSPHPHENDNSTVKISHNSLWVFPTTCRGGKIIRPTFQMKKLKHQVFPWAGAQQRLCLGLLTCIMGS